MKNSQNRNQDQIIENLNQQVKEFRQILAKIQVGIQKLKTDSIHHINNLIGDLEYFRRIHNTDTGSETIKAARLFRESIS